MPLGLCRSLLAKPRVRSTSRNRASRPVPVERIRLITNDLWPFTLSGISKTIVCRPSAYMARA